MKSAGIIGKITFSSIIILLVASVLIGMLFYLARLSAAPGASQQPFLSYCLWFLLVFYLPVVMLLVTARIAYLAPLSPIYLPGGRTEALQPAAGTLPAAARKRLFKLPVFTFVLNALVFAAAFPFFASFFGFLSGGVILKTSLFLAMGLTFSCMYSFVQTSLDFRLLAPMYRAFEGNVPDKEDKKVRLGVRFSVNLLFTAATVFGLLFAMNVVHDLRRAERFQASLVRSVAEEKMTAAQAARLSENPRNIETANGGGRNDPGFVAAFLILAGLGVISVFPFTAGLRRRILAQRSLLENILCGGDFSQKRISVIERDEIGVSSLTINSFIEKFKGILEGIFSGTNTVQTVSGSLDTSLTNASAAIEEMVTTIKQITANTSTQMDMVKNVRAKIEEMLVGIDGTSFDVVELSNFVQETSSAMHQTTANIQTIAKNTEQVNALANRLVEISQHGSFSVNETVSAIREIEKASAQVGNIVDVISNIASQTNLLSLNASIEAAHAGEMGKGFAVVAGEIRKLAEQSNENIALIVKQITDMAERVKTGVALTSTADAAFRKIDEDIKLTTQHIGQVTIALQEQNQGTHDIMTALEEMVKKTVEVKEIAEDLKRMSEEIHKFMDELFNISTHINDATGEQNKGNKEILALITTVKNASQKNLSVVDSLHTIVNDYQSKRVKENRALAV